MLNQTNTAHKLKISLGRWWGGEEEEVVVQHVMRVSLKKGKKRRANPIRHLFSFPPASHFHSSISPSELLLRRSPSSGDQGRSPGAATAQSHCHSSGTHNRAAGVRSLCSRLRGLKPVCHLHQEASKARELWKTKRWGWHSWCPSRTAIK